MPTCLLDQTNQHCVLTPPVGHPHPVTLRLCQERNIITKTKPMHVYPENCPNHTRFFFEESNGTMMYVEPSKLRDFILNLNTVNAKYTNLQMYSPHEPIGYRLAHVISLSHVEALSKPLGLVLRHMIQQLHETQSALTVPWELQFICDPTPVLPKIRKYLPITAN